MALTPVAGIPDRYRNLIEDLPAVVYTLVVRKDGVVTPRDFYIGPRVLGLTGYSSEEIGQDPGLWQALVVPDDRLQLASARALGQGLRDRLVTEYRIRCRDGSMKWLRDEAIVRETGDGDVFLHGVVTDVTAEKEAQAALAASERLLGLVGSRGGDIVYQRRLDGDHAFEYISPAVEAVLGYPPDAFYARPELGEALVHPGDAEAVERLRAGDDAVFRARHRDGSWVWLEGRVEVTPGPPHGMLVGAFRDVTARKLAEDRRQQTEVELAKVIENAALAYAGADEDGRIVEWNAEAERMFGWTRDEVIGRSLASTLVPPERREHHVRGFRALVESGQGERQVRRLEVEALHRSGRRFIAELSLWATVTGSGRRFSALIQEISDRKRLEQDLRSMALHDSLTQLPNQTLLLDRLARSLSVARGTGVPTVVVVDLDAFRLINDAYGRAAGDKVLVAAAGRLRSVAGDVDTVARGGGDEFAVLLESVDGAADAGVFSGRLVEAFRRPFVIDGTEIFATASVGVAMAETDSTPEQMLRDASAAMYRAKARGRSRSEIFEDGMRPSGLSRVHIANSLRRAIENEEFALDYQPIVDMRTGALASVEALLRWRTADGTFVPPAVFLPVAEETGLIDPIGRWVVGEAVKRAGAWRRSGIDARVSINMSMQNLEAPDILTTLRSQLEKWNTPPDAIALELTETAATADLDVTKRVIADVRGMGIRVSIDDFGTGYSSLAYIQHLRVDEVKIDQSFVQGILANTESEAIVRSAIGLGHELNLSVVAEGIEDEATWKALRRLGCDLAQGYWIGRPMPLSDLRRWQRSWRADRRTAVAP
jgi:diguanylate cyclase (GGDEF)-like protein/PAS domain S-box-containing protein